MFNVVPRLNILYHLRQPLPPLEPIASVLALGGVMLTTTIFQRDMRTGRWALDPRRHRQKYYYPGNERSNDQAMRVGKEPTASGVGAAVNGLP